MGGFLAAGAKFVATKVVPTILKSGVKVKASTAAAATAAAVGAREVLKPPDLPSPPEPTPLPEPDSDEVRLARRRSIARQVARSGRQSTILSQPGGKLGGGT